MRLKAANARDGVCCCERVGAVLLMRDTRERSPQLSVSLQA